jgi:hypothetical protein
MTAFDRVDEVGELILLGLILGGSHAGEVDFLLGIDTEVTTGVL